MFYLTALVSGEPASPAWEKDGISGVILWAYERGSLATFVVLFLLSVLCGWLMPFNALLAAVSLALFYPLFAIVSLVLGLHKGNLVPFEFLGYMLDIVICLLGYGVGRFLAKRIPKAA